MTNDNQFKPTNQHFKELRNIPKTETRIVLNDWSQEAKKSKLSASARSKVINRSGSNYLSENKGYGPCSYSGCNHRSKPFDMDIGIQGCKWWARNSDYGGSLPGSWTWSPTNSYLYRDNLWLNHMGHAQDADGLIGQNNLYTVNTVGAYAMEDYEFCVGTQNLIRECIRVHEQGYPIDEPRTLPSETTRATKWTIKTAVAVGSAFIPGGASVGVAVAGGTLWAANEGIQQISNNKIVNSVSSIVGDTGKDVARGVAIGNAFETGGLILGEMATGGSKIGGEIFGKYAGSIGEKVGLGISGFEFVSHTSHLVAGKSYDQDCWVCNSSD